jgi:hypothetical protein
MNPMNWFYITALVWILAAAKLHLTVVETFVAFFATWTFIKLILLKQDSKGYMNWATKAFKKNNNIKFFRFLFLLIFGSIAYALIPEIGIVNFFGAFIAGVALYAHTLMHYPKVMGVYVQQFKGKNILSQIAFDWMIWLGLGAWALYEILMNCGCV